MLNCIREPGTPAPNLVQIPATAQLVQLGSVGLPREASSLTEGITELPLHASPLPQTLLGGLLELDALLCQLPRHPPLREESLAALVHSGNPQSVAILHRRRILAESGLSQEARSQPGSPRIAEHLLGQRAWSRLGRSITRDEEDTATLARGPYRPPQIFDHHGLKPLSQDQLHGRLEPLGWLEQIRHDPHHPRIR